MPPTHTDEGLVAAREIRGSFPEVGVLVLSQHLDARYALRLLEGYPERVGYLLKERVSDVAVLTDAVRRIAEGECVIDPTIVSQLMRRRDSAGTFAEATNEERNVASLVAEGYSDESIAQQLHSDVETVRERIERACALLGIRDSPDDLRRVGLLLRSCGRRPTESASGSVLSGDGRRQDAVSHSAPWGNCIRRPPSP